MAANQWYVRVRGKVMGPLNLARLKELRDRGQFRRFHEVSEDQRTWVTAATIGELFPPESVAVEAPPPAAMSAPAPTPAAPHQPAAPQPALPEWHYLDAGGAQQGPVTQEQLLGFLQTGVV